MKAMKNFRLTVVLLGALTGASLPAHAQGVILSAGDSLVIAFNGVGNGVGNCEFIEDPFIGGWGIVRFGNDTLGPGESLKLELFENDPGEPPIVAQTYSPATSLTGVSLRSPGAWLDFQGALRISMFNGTVNVTDATLVVFPSLNSWCGTVVTVPEPRATLFLKLTIVVGAVFKLWRPIRK